MDRLEAAGGLWLDLSEPGALRVAFGEPDWLGPLSLAVAGRDAGPGRIAAGPSEGADDLGRYTGVDLEWEGLPLAVATRVRAYRDVPLLVFRLEALEDLSGLASGDFAEPVLAWPWLRPARRRAGGAPEGLRGYGHQYTEFAFASFAGPELADFRLFPFRPPVVEPLWLNAPDGRSLMLAPLDAFHDQVIAVPKGAGEAARGVRCGWHGDLDAAPRGFASELAVWAGPGPRRVLEDWAAALRRRHATRRPSRYADPLLARLSYWTDNGAAYWYRSEPGRGLPETLEALAGSLAEQRVPVGAFEIDSWFYTHEITRPVAPGPAAPQQVPPTGLLLWEPRGDVLPEGLRDLRRRLGDPPLVAHLRHYSSRSPYFAAGGAPAWKDGDRAHPEDPAFFDRLMRQAVSWGLVSIEQDWLVEIFLGVRGLRERPGRARAWQEGFDRAAREHGLGLVWCMATPADFFETLTLERVGAIRTSGDYRYATGNASLWVRFLYTNALARALGLHPFKDVFLSDASAGGWDGDPHAEAEALLAALSAGPVGIGDRIGRSDRTLVLRTCRADGVLVKPDLPIAAIERCLRRDCYFEPEPLVGETWTDHPAGRWSYVAAFDAYRKRSAMAFELPLAELGDAAPQGPAIAYRWRSGECERVEPGGALHFSLEPDDWDLRVLCPVLEGELAVFGDTSLYACAGDRRIASVRSAEGGIELDVCGAPGERVEVSGWSARPLRSAQVWSPDTAARPAPVHQDAPQRWRVALELPPRGWVALRLEPDVS